MRKIHVVAAAVIISFALTLGNTFLADEPVSKDIVFEIAKDYEACEFTIKTEKEGNFDVILKNGQTTYRGSIEGSNTCIISVEDVKAGRWNVNVTQKQTEEEMIVDQPELEAEDAEADVQSDQTQTGENPLSADEVIGKVQVTAKAIDKTAFSIGNVRVARDIVGLQLYFKDDAIVAEWTDTSCGNVIVSVIDTYTNQILDTQTITGRYYEFEIPELVSEITVDIVPATSSNITGADSRFTKKVENSPNAVVSYEDKKYVNTETVPVTVNLGDVYSLIFFVNGSEVKKTGDLTSGEYVFDIPITEGTNEILTYVVDADHNMRSTAALIIRDSIKPALTLDMEYDGITTYDDFITITGTIKDYDTFMVNETKPVVAGDGSFKCEYILKDGENKLDVLATDNAGNETLYSATVIKAVKETTIRDYAGPIGIGLILICGIVFKLHSKKNCKSAEDGEGVQEKHHREKKVKTPQKDLSGKKKTAVYGIIGFISLICSYLFFTHVIIGGWIPSSSMEPTLQIGDYAISNGLAYVRHEPQRGDIIIFRHADVGIGDGGTLVKRIIGVPGDSIMFIDGYVYLNGELVYETYLPENTETNSYKDYEDIPEGCYFVMGDNREDSFDSRFWEDPYVRRSEIRGKLLSVIPFARLKEAVEGLFY